MLPYIVNSEVTRDKPYTPPLDGPALTEPNSNNRESSEPCKQAMCVVLACPVWREIVFDNFVSNMPTQSRAYSEVAMDASANWKLPTPVPRCNGRW